MALKVTTVRLSTWHSHRYDESQVPWESLLHEHGRPIPAARFVFCPWSELVFHLRIAFCVAILTVQNLDRLFQICVLHLSHEVGISSDRCFERRIQSSSSPRENYYGAEQTAFARRLFFELLC